MKRTITITLTSGQYNALLDALGVGEDYITDLLDSDGVASDLRRVRRAELKRLLEARNALVDAWGKRIR